MADGRAPTPALSDRPAPWTLIFRCFQIALDPRKLFVAAVGILVMSFLWWLLSVLFAYKAPDRNADAYSNSRVINDGGQKDKLAAYTREEEEKERRAQPGKEPD